MNFYTKVIRVKQQGFHNDRDHFKYGDRVPINSNNMSMDWTNSYIRGETTIYDCCYGRWALYPNASERTH